MHVCESWINGGIYARVALVGPLSHCAVPADAQVAFGGKRKCRLPFACRIAVLKDHIHHMAMRK